MIENPPREDEEVFKEVKKLMDVMQTFKLLCSSNLILKAEKLENPLRVLSILENEV